MDQSVEDERREEVAQAALTRDAMQALLKSQGWDILRTIFESQVETIVTKLLSTPASPESIYSLEYEKGMAAAYKVILKMPKTLIEQAELSTPDDKEDANG